MIHGNSHKSTSKDIRLHHEVSEADLLAEYEDRILCGDHPALDEYMGRYTGVDPHNFRIELELTAALLIAGQQRRVESN